MSLALVLHFGAGALLTLSGWLKARAMANARHWRPLGALALDALAPFGTFLLLFLATGKPVFAGIVPFAAFAGFAFADKVKRTTLREPVIFTDLSEIRELFRHPDLYLPFAGTGRVLAGAVAAFAFFLIVLLVDPPVLHPSLLQTVASLAAGPLLIFLIMRFWSTGWANLLRRFAPEGDLYGDAARLGPLAVLLIYGAIARDGRASRRAGLEPRAASKPWTNKPPIILVQCESFFDARRLHTDVPADLLPAFEESCRTSVQWGRLTVPCWGANTIRTEFAVLSGLPETALALDRFNPYHAFAKVPVETLAWKLKVQGYRTLCVHPFDPTFYNRDRIMPLLGFDAIIGAEAFSDSERAGRYISDDAVARYCARLLEDHRGTPLFIFAITMENHGPWLEPPTPQSMAELVGGLGILPESQGLGHYLNGLRHADTMIAALERALAEADQNGVLAFYGDHLPSFPAAFAHLGFGDIATDYFIRRGRPGPSRRQDIAAQDLSAALLALLEDARG